MPVPAASTLPIPDMNVILTAMLARLPARSSDSASTLPDRVPPAIG